MEERGNLTHRQQMADAEAQCLPCKLCGGKAIITDAGRGAGYYIECSGALTFNKWKGCLIEQRRLSGWAYNVMEWWNRLHADRTPDADHQAAMQRDGERVGELEVEVAALREGIITAGRAARCVLADDVSTDFLRLVPFEIGRRIRSLEAGLRVARGWAQCNRGSAQARRDLLTIDAALGLATPTGGDAR